MPPLPVITDVFRVTLNWNPAHGITPRNVLHFFSTLSGTEAQLATALHDNFDDNQWIAVQQDWAFDSVDIIKLDGTSATQTIALAAEGSLTSGDWVPQSCALVSAHTATRGARGRGRVYLGPIAESQQLNGTVVAAGGIGTAWEGFRAGMDADGWPWVIASYTHADAHEVTSVHCDTLCATQRRRQDQLR